MMHMVNTPGGYYVVEDKYVRVLGIKHQLQNDNWIE